MTEVEQNEAMIPGSEATTDIENASEIGIKPADEALKESSVDNSSAMPSNISELKRHNTAIFAQSLGSQKK